MSQVTAANRTVAIKWAASLALPALLFILLQGVEGLNRPMILFLCITLWAVACWALDTMNDTAIGLLLPVLYIILCGAPQKVVFGPWTSDIPIIVIGGFVLGRVILDTGLGKRLALGCMRAMGGSFSAALIGITAAAAIVAPFVPAITGKAAIFCAVAISMCEALDFKAKSREATAVMLAACLGVASTKLCYLTGGGDVLMGMSLLAKATNTPMSTWTEFAVHNFVPGMIYTLMSLGIVLFVLRSKVGKSELKSVLETKYAELGPMKAAEKKAAVLFALTLVLISTDKLHGIATGYVFIIVSMATFLPGLNLMDGGRLARINFSPLFFIMGCMSIGAAGGFLKVTDWLAKLILPMFHDMGTSLAGLSTYTMGAAVNFLLTPLAATSTLTSPLGVLGVDMGLDPRILFYSFLYGLDSYVFPYEYAVLLYFFATGYMGMKDMVKVLGARMILTAVFLLVVAIPYWKMVIS